MIVQILDDFENKTVYETCFGIDYKKEIKTIKELLNILWKNLTDKNSIEFFLEDLKCQLEENNEDYVMENIKNFEDTDIGEIYSFYKDMKPFMKDDSLKYPYKLIIQ